MEKQILTIYKLKVVAKIREKWRTIVLLISLYLSCSSLLLATTLENSLTLQQTQTTLDNKLQTGLPIYLRIFKQEHLLELYVKVNDKFQLHKEYPICTYSGGLGPKKLERDMRSPEGFYQTTLKDLNPNSRYRRSFDIGYPNDYDRNHGYTGRFLMIHGQCISQGCYALGDENIEEVYRWVQKALENGQDKVDVHIYPFKMTDKNLQSHKNSEHADFWEQLRPGYDLFAETSLPPQALVINNRYLIVPGSDLSNLDHLVDSIQKTLNN